jgi:hypothetical protein
MELVRVLDQLGWSDSQPIREALELEWTDSQRALAAERPPGLEPTIIEDACEQLRIAGPAVKGLLGLAEHVVSKASLSALFWHFHYCAFRSTTFPLWLKIRLWPGVDEYRRDPDLDGRLFYTLVLLSGLGPMRQHYSERDIPAEVLERSLESLVTELQNDPYEPGQWGVYGPERLEWFRFYLRGEIFRLGRLEYQFGDFGYPFRVYRHEGTNAVLALCAGGITYLSDGQREGPGRLCEPTDTWVSEFEETPAGATGNPILPTGRALPRRVHLPSSEWKIVLAPGALGLYLHLPADGPLLPELCRRSYEEATAFFARHFPDRPASFLFCTSWVLDTEIGNLISEPSNILEFQKDVYLFPFLTDDRHLYEVIFNGVPEIADGSPLPHSLTPGYTNRNTRLQQALLERLSARERVPASAGGCFLLAEDIGRGRQVYRRQQYPSDLGL